MPTILQEYIDAAADPSRGVQYLVDERKRQMLRVSELRKRPIVTYAARMNTPIPLPVGINSGDVLHFHDTVRDIGGDAIDVIIETPGGDGSAARDMVEMLHEKFAHVAFIIPGTAKSAGTIMAMGGHEILMGPTSALGPIDAQVVFEGKQFSADALLEGVEEIKREVNKNGRLNLAFVPILQRLSPGDLQHARNVMSFGKDTVADWLSKYKFANWTHHRTHNKGKPVTPREKKLRARAIANELAKHSKWKMHGRSLRLPELAAMRLEIEDVSKAPDLYDAIYRYYVLLRLFLDMGNAYKIFETPGAQVVHNFNAVQQQPAAPTPQPLPPSVVVSVPCPSCSNQTNIQMNFAPNQPVDPMALPYPANDEAVCPRCTHRFNVANLRAQVENKFGHPIIP